MFPFDIPEDLTSLSAEEFAAFTSKVREFVKTTLADDKADAETLVATRELFSGVTAEETRRTELSASAEKARAELAKGMEPTPTPTPEPTPTLDKVPDVEPERHASLIASSDAPGVGGTLESFSEAGKLIERRLSTYSSGVATNPRNRPIRGTTNRFKIGGRSMVRHGSVAIRREYPEDLIIRDGKEAMSVLEYATGEKRLPGGSLATSMAAQVAAGKSLTAAAGWCAPSETIYDLCELETMDGLLDIPEVQATRGGFFIPENGGPDFSVIYDSIGDAGDVILTEYDVQNDTAKICTEIPCPDFVEVRLDVAYVCITGSLLQRRGYPEAVTRFSRGVMTALAHKVNESVIARIVAGSGAPVTIPTIAGSDDAASQLLSAVELAIEDMRYRHRMGRGQTMEVVLPAWVMVPIRAALARRSGVAMINVSNAEILAAFTTRGAVPRFVYDWQDAYSGLVGGPGASTSLTALPEDVSFLVYPAGTWVKPVRDVVNLDTVYDNAMLTQNQFTALFAEDGFNVMKMCADSRLYTVDVDPAGIVGCCTAS